MGAAAGVQADRARRRIVIDAREWLIVFMDVSGVDHFAFHFNPIP
jgi:hypothetical protein